MIETLAILTILCGLYVIAGAAAKMIEKYEWMKRQRPDPWFPTGFQIQEKAREKENDVW